MFLSFLVVCPDAPYTQRGLKRSHDDDLQPVRKILFKEEQEDDEEDAEDEEEEASLVIIEPPECPQILPGDFDDTF